MEKINITISGLKDNVYAVEQDAHYTFGLDMRKMDGDVNIDHEFVFAKKGLKVEIEYRFITDPKYKCKSKVKLTALKGNKNVYAHLTMKTLVLHDNSSATLMPFLQIDEKDVDVDHSVSMGSIDKETLFYFASRGIDTEIAKEIIAENFVQFD